jgi:hypothetical protein
MLYQLPHGKVVYLTIEQYLDLTPEDIQYLISTGMGEQPLTPFFGSSLSNTSSKIKPDDIDYQPDDDETDTSGPISIDNI